MSVIRLSTQQWSAYLADLRGNAQLMACELRRRRQAKARNRAAQLAEANLPLVQKLARAMWRKYSRHGQNGFVSHLLIEDFVGYGCVGLMQAIHRFAPAAPMEDFPRYALRRIRGAIIDAHRRGQYRDQCMLSIDACTPISKDGEEDQVYPERVPVDISPLPDALAGSREQLRRLQQAIHRLLPEDQQQVILAALAGRPLQETAEECGRSVHWARKKLALAKNRLSHEFQRAA
ncbi:MAG TPA: sigma-70 family RNA polymerase sigma factor [Terracidiphilus sp.]|nr:sigma-70 family RNA polymerase sigma factor [Terracidiphilus sp.]